MNITGTDIWYYFICKRELWFIIRKIVPDQEDENVEIGRFLHEYYSNRGKKEVDIGSGKIDRVKKVDGKLIIQEIKKTDRFKKSSYYQLLFYLYELQKMGIEATGESNIRELEKAIEDIKKYAKWPVPPPPKKIKVCSRCAYREYCWAGED